MSDLVTRERCGFVTAANMRCLLYDGHPDACDLGILAGAVCICGTANPENHFRWCPSLPTANEWMYPAPGNDLSSRMSRFIEQNGWRLGREYEQVKEWMSGGDTDALVAWMTRDNAQRAAIQAARAKGLDVW